MWQDIVSVFLVVVSALLFFESVHNSLKDDEDPKLPIAYAIYFVLLAVLAQML